MQFVTEMLPSAGNLNVVCEEQNPYLTTQSLKTPPRGENIYVFKILTGGQIHKIMFLDRFDYGISSHLWHILTNLDRWSRNLIFV
jgi:hypothetical protein